MLLQLSKNIEFAIYRLCNDFIEINSVFPISIFKGLLFLQGKSDIKDISLNKYILYYIC